jgi:hypothetical protein
MASESTQRRMALLSSPLPLSMSNDVHPDILNALSQGDFVLLHNGKLQRLFHTHVKSRPSGGCSSRTHYSEDPLKKLSEGAHLICVDLTVHPYLSNLMEWPNKIDIAGYGECKCSLKNRVSQVLPITNWTYIDGVIYK